MTINHAVVLDKISEIENDIQFVNFIKYCAPLLVKYKDKLISRCATLQYTQSSNDIMGVLYYNLSTREFDEYGYDLLKAYFAHMPNHYNDTIASVALVPFNNLQELNEIYNDKTGLDNLWAKKYLKNIMDCYVPTYSSEVLANVILKALDGNITNAQHAAENNFYRERLNEICVKHPSLVNDAIGVFTIIQSILESEEAAKEFCMKLHAFDTVDAPFRADAHDIACKYCQYFSMEPVEMLPFVYSIIDAYLGDIKHIGIQVRYILFDLCSTDDTVPAIQLEGKQKIIAASFLSDIFRLFKHGFEDVDEEKIDIITNLIYEVRNIDDFKAVQYQYDYDEDETPEIATEAKKGASAYHKVDNAIYRAFKKFKNAEDKIDSQLSKLTKDLKNLVLGDAREEIIEGKRYTPIKLLKKILGTAAIFSFGPIKGIIILVVQHALSKKRTRAERQKVLLELHAELEIINEKIDDARGDGNRQAKYSLMRTKTEIENAIHKIKLGIEADDRSMDTAEKILKKR